MRRLIAALTATVLALSACSGDDAPDHPYASAATSLGGALTVLGWNMTAANLRFEAEHVLVDIEATGEATQADSARTKPEDLRFGLYGALSHPIEAGATTGCDDVTNLGVQPLAATEPDKLSGTVCLGPIRDQSQVRGVYVYSPQDRIAGTTVAYPAAFPVGVPRTSDSATGLTLQTTSVDAFRADGAKLAHTALGDPEAFTGNGYLLLGLDIAGLATRYRDDSATRGGPMMVVAAPTLPPPGLSHACSTYGASVLVLPDAVLDAVKVQASLCTQGEINQALLYPTVSVIGTHAGLWTQHD